LGNQSSPAQWVIWAFSAGMKLLMAKAELESPCSTEVNEWWCTSNHLHTTMAYTSNILAFEPFLAQSYTYFPRICKPSQSYGPEKNYVQEIPS
jgi:hypothetical protein